MAAHALDVGVPYALVLFVWIGLGSRGGDTSTTLGALFLIAIAPYLVWSWTTQGATIAMGALGMWIEADSGGPVGLGPAVVRLVALGLLQFLALFVLFAALYLILSSFDPGKLTLTAVAVLLALIFGGAALLYAALRKTPYWHDRLAQTVVLRRQ